MAQKSSDHQSRLQQYCRAYGKVTRKKEYKYSYTENLHLLQACGLDVASDQEHIHPESFCGSCRSKAKRFADGKQVQNFLNPPVSTEHTGTECWVCQENKEGRPVKERGKWGHAGEGSNKYVASKIIHRAPESFK